MTEYLTTKELASLLRIKERKVYDLVASGAVPCTRATGKLLFPRQAVDEWLARNESPGAAAISRPLVFVGSHDPLLEWTLRASECGLASFFDSSLDGLERFAAAEGIAAGMHIYDAETDSWNTAAVKSRCAQARAVLVEWARRTRGIILAPEAAGKFNSLGDLAGKTIVPRQPGAGSQILLESLLQRQGIDPGELKWAPPARSEADAVIEIVEGRADATFGLAMLARQYRLGFEPMVDERYDILVERRAWFEPAWQSLLGFCGTPAFHDHARQLSGYNVENQFRVRYNCKG